MTPGDIFQGELLVGTVTHVRDGDTLEVNQQPVRLSGLICDERGTPLGDLTTRALRSLTTGQV